MHVVTGVRRIRDTRAVIFWWLEWLVLGLDLLGVPEWYQLVVLWTRPSLKPLDDSSYQLALSVLRPDFIDWNMVCLNQKAWIGPKKYKMAYVSFNIINSWGEIRDSTFIHELIHVWQYQRLGSVYIVRALRAQFSEQTYDYGGLAGLRNLYLNGGHFTDLNFEQQGDVLSDYFRIKTGRLKLRGVGRLDSLKLYEALLAPWVV